MELRRCATEHGECDVHQEYGGDHRCRELESRREDRARGHDHRMKAGTKIDRCTQRHRDEALGDRFEHHDVAAADKQRDERE